MNVSLKITLHSHQYVLVSRSSDTEIVPANKLHESRLEEPYEEGKGLGGGQRWRTKQFFLRLAVCNVIYYVADRAIKVNSAVLSLFLFSLSRWPLSLSCFTPSQ